MLENYFYPDGITSGKIMQKSHVCIQLPTWIYPRKMGVKLIENKIIKKCHQ